MSKADFLVGSRPFTLTQRETQALHDDAELVLELTRSQRAGWRVGVAQAVLRMMKIVKGALGRSVHTFESGN